MELPQQHERLMELIGHVRDGDLDDTETRELEAIIEEDPAALAYYVEAVDVMSMLHRQQGVTTERQGSDAAPSPAPVHVVPSKGSSLWSVAGWSAALCASLVLGIFLGGKLLPRGGSSTTSPKDQAALVDGQGSEIATLSYASGCRWDSGDRTRFEGQRLTSETMRLEEGVAVIRLDSDVRLVLEGPVQLDLVSVDRAMLRYGNVVFCGNGDLDRFTLQTPFSRITDEGTEYAVSVDRDGRVSEIHVFDGRAICEASESKLVDRKIQSIEIDAGDARRFSDSGTSETIELATTRFVREPTVPQESPDTLWAKETFAYGMESLDGQSSGVGWGKPWKVGSDAPSNAMLRPSESLAWPGVEVDSGSGSLLIQGDTNLFRIIEKPIRMDQDAAWYLSFLVRRSSNTGNAKPRGWGYLTLRNSETKAGHVSIGAVTRAGTPRVTHDGRVMTSTDALREDTVYLFVCKILAQSDRPDQISIRIYADQDDVDTVEPTAWNITTRPVDSDSVLNELKFSAKNCPPTQFDEIRIGKSWSSVTASYSD